MWYVFYSEDDYTQGWTVPSERDAIEYCLNHTGYDYKYVG